MPASGAERRLAAFEHCRIGNRDASSITSTVLTQQYTSCNLDAQEGMECTANKILTMPSPPAP